MRNNRLEGVMYYPTQNCGAEIVPKIIVVHYTASRTLMSTVRWFRTPKSNASAHLIVGKDGKIVQMIPFNQKAWHVGLSSYEGRENCNNFSIGIELCNWGKLIYRNGMFRSWAGVSLLEEEVFKGPHKYDFSKEEYWEKYTEDQMSSLIEACKEIIKEYDITDIVGHDDVAIPYGRKADPGPAFDMSRLRVELGFEKKEREVTAYSTLVKELIHVREDMESVVKRVDRIINQRV